MKYIVLFCSFISQINCEIKQIYYDETQVANSNSTFNIQTDSYCFCDLKVNEADNQCCCDTLVTDKTNCLLGSVKKSCIKKYILSKQNVDQWIQVSEEDNNICFIYEKGTLSTSDAKLPDAFNNPELLQTFFKDYIIPNSKLKNYDDHTELYQTFTNTNFKIYYRDSNGICRNYKQTINYKQIEKQLCFMLSCPAAIEQDTGCRNGQSIFMGYTLSASPSSFSNNQGTRYFTTSSSTNYNYFSEVIYAVSTTNSNFQGKAGYEYGQYVQGYVNKATNPTGFLIYKGKVSQDDSTCLLTKDDDKDKLKLQPLQFGKNIQFSCTYSLNQTVTSSFKWTDLLLFTSFPQGSSIALARTPIFSDSTTDFIIAQETTTTSDSIYLTQNVLIFTDEFGMKEGRQNYIRQINIVYSNQILKTNIPTNSINYRFNTKIKFINLPYEQIENTQPQDPPFIPQLPSDIFFPIWYETFAHYLEMNFIILFIIYI